MDVKKNLAIDVAALAVYLVAANPAITCFAVHEWVGLAVLVVFFVHVLVHVQWVVDAARNMYAHPSRAQTGGFVLNALIFVTFAVVTVSGVLISGAVFPALGLYANGYYVWDPLHAISAKVLLALLLVHVVLHWKWFARVLRKGEDGSHGD